LFHELINVLSFFAARVEKTPISKTFAAHFSSFCRQDLGWKVLTNDRIQASGRRLCSRIDLASFSPQFKPRIFSEAEMAASSYRAEKKMESERARKQKERLQSDKVVMPGTLEDSKLRALDKAKHPQNEDDTGAR